MHTRTFLALAIAAQACGSPATNTTAAAPKLATTGGTLLSGQPSSKELTIAPGPGHHPAPVVISVAAARDGTCAVTKQGAVHCWGNAAPGPLRLRLRPERLVGIDDAMAIVAGSYNTFCALRKQHPLTCWGGLLPSEGAERRPQELAPLRAERPTDVAISESAVCAVADGAVRCIGINGGDRLFPGNSAEGIDQLVAIEHGFLFTTRAGWSCTGEAFYNQCLGGESDAAKLPRRIALPPMRSVKNRDGMLCGIEESGDVACWGQYITSNSEQRGWATAPPRRIELLRGAEELAVLQSGQVCARFSGGRVGCTIVNSAKPELTMVMADGARQLMAGHAHACAVDVAGKLSCFGDSGLGVLGNDPPLFVTTPTKLAGIEDAERILLKDSRTYVQRKNGELLAWGFVDDEVGEGAVISRGSVSDRLALPGRLSSEVLLRSGADAPLALHGFESALVVRTDVTGELTCGLFPDRTVRCKGLTSINDAKQNGSILSYGIGDVRVESADELIMSAGGGGCARLTTGGIACFGIPSWSGRVFGKPMNGKTVVLTGPKGQDLISIAWFRDEVCAVDEAGALFCDGTSDGSTEFIDRIHSVASMPAVRSIVASKRGFCALAKGGTVHCFGVNDLGQLGVGDNAARTGPQKLVGVMDAVELAMGENHGCARTRGRVVLCWGDNYFGQTGVPLPPGTSGPVEPAW